MITEEIEETLLGTIRGMQKGNVLDHTSLVDLTKALLKPMSRQFAWELTTNEEEKLVNLVVERYEILIGVIQPLPVILDNGDPSEWFIDLKPTLNFEYSNRYFDYLRRNDFADDTIKVIQQSTEKVLSYCANPKGSSYINAQKKRGLVVGDVQSGKTSNYISLINMACDAGYNIVVLLAGMTSSLRQQTQDRIDEGFIGAKSDTLSGGPEYIGVGIDSHKYYGIPLTNHTSDFVKYVKQNQNAGSEDYVKPIVLVVKKNKSILESVSEWLKPGKNNIKKQSNILIIDDEADNASVNTKRDPSEMTAINSAIRKIYNNFPIASYVGYTATPFANIFINPFEVDPSNQDLFPSDFIVLLETPSNYFGFDKAFEKINGEYKHISIIDQNDINYLPTNHKKDVYYDGLAEDLKDAILNFYISNVIRTLDGKKTKHRSMLVNISRFNDVQKQIVEKIQEYHDAFKDELEELDMQDDIHYFKSLKLKRLYELYMTEKNYENARKKYTWNDVKAQLWNEVKQVNISLINNSIKSRFSYDDYKNIGARVIIVGGFVLSRGLTLEGLMISYFDRNSVAYDTLMQMCRWFGYRFGYEDLCKIYMTQESLDSFEAVNDAVDNLKDQFRQLANSNKTPKDFGLMVKESPDTLDTALLVTARNKMYSTKQVYCTLNYSGFAVDTSKIFKNQHLTIHNYNQVKQLFDNLISEGFVIDNSKNRLFVENISSDVVAKFIKNIKIPFENTKFDQDSISDYILSDNNQYKKWDVVVASGASAISFELYPGKSVKASERNYDDDNKFDNEDFFRVSGTKNRLFEPSIFAAGLNEFEINQVKKYAKNEMESGRRKSSTPIVLDYLNVQGRKPLLVIYPVVLHGKNNKDTFDKAKFKNVVYGFAVGFPATEKGIRIKYRANKIKLEQLLNKYYDEYDEEAEDDD